MVGFLVEATRDRCLFMCLRSALSLTIMRKLNPRNHITYCYRPWLLVIAALAIAATTNAGSSQSNADNNGDSTQEARALERECVANLRTLGVAQITYAALHPEKGFAQYLDQLGTHGDNLIGLPLQDGFAYGYRFTLIAKGLPVKQYVILANPARRISDDQRSYYADETDIIRYTTQKRDATQSDSKINE
jgi:hypothetical protein